MTRRAVIVAAYAVLLAVVFHRVWRGQMFFGWDCLREYWPDLLYPVHALRAGELPLWNPYALGGYPFWGDPQAGLFSPTSWLCYLLSFVSEGPWLIQVKVLVNMWIGLAGMHFLCARRTGSDLAGALGALAYVLGSPLLVHKNGAFLWPLLYLPWAVLALEHFLDRPSAGRGALLAIAVGLCGSAGHPQGFFYDLVIVMSYWAFRVARAPRGLRAQLPGAAAFVVVALALLLPVYWPAAQAVAASPRSARGLAYVLQASMQRERLVKIVAPIPDTDWATDLYVGGLPLVAAAVGIVAAGRRAEAAFWLALATLGIVLALGEHTPVLPFFAKHVPGFGLFRIAYRHKVIFGFALAVAGADGAAAAMARPRLLLAATAAWAVAAAVLAYHHPPAHWAVILSVPALALLPTRLRWGAAGLLLADLYVAGQFKLDIMQPTPDLARDRAAVATIADRGFRYESDQILPYHLPFLYDVRELSGFLNPIVLRRQEDLMAHVSQPLLEKMNVRWWWSRGGLRELPDATPLARVYPAAEMLAPAQALARLGDPAPLAAAIVEPGDAPAGLPASAFDPVDGRLVSYGRNRIEVAVDAPAPGILVLAEAFFPGWRAEVNDRDATVFRANYFLRAVAVPAGASRVVFRYAPPLAIPLFALFFVGLGGAVVLARRRPASAAAPPAPPA
jgi:hypothetical protein